MSVLLHVEPEGLEEVQWSFYERGQALHAGEEVEDGVELGVGLLLEVPMILLYRSMAIASPPRTLVVNSSQRSSSDLS